MSAPRPVEATLLGPAEAALVKAIGEEQEGNGFELRLQILEAASAHFGGFDLAAFHKAFDVQLARPLDELLELSEPVVNAIKRLPIHHAQALSALSRETLCEQDRKNTGAYHTDFRLATRIAELASPNLTYESKVIDPASGAGILLAALTYAVCGMDRSKIAHWLAHGVFASDLSANSLRATLISLASFTDDVGALQAMRARWYCGDSLLADHAIWTAMAPEGFDAVIGNPPWDKVKLSKHEFIKSAGTQRNYGAEIYGLDEKRFNVQREEKEKYSRKLLARYPDLGNGEPDLYIAFTDLFFELCKEQGVVAALIPGGLIRSHGTKAMRQKIFEASQNVSLSIIDNRARFFAIDTRFKFLAVVLVKASANTSRREPILLRHERGTPTGLENAGTAVIGRSALKAVREDLSIPEVRSDAEWQLFSKIADMGVSWEEPDCGWTPKFCREVDMTKERPRFLNHAITGALPLVEGRMVQSHRFGVKGYLSGAGRSAVWQAYKIGDSCLSPQFWILPSDVPQAHRQRTNKLRAGFCDIAGQTNERSLMAALVPPGTVCGNKVPTILFLEDSSEERLLVWIAIANSFVFDWMLRRVLTTTVNYFVLQSLPLPNLTQNGLPWNKLANCSRELRALDSAGASQRVYERMAEVRAEIDAEVAVAYGLNLDDMELVLKDFPILDRGQVTLQGELKSTITRDTALSAVAKRTSSLAKVWLNRMEEANSLGAIAYVPSQIALVDERSKKKRVQNNG